MSLSLTYQELLLKAVATVERTTARAPESKGSQRKAEPENGSTFESDESKEPSSIDK